MFSRYHIILSDRNFYILLGLQKEQSREDVLAIKHEMQSFTNRIRVLESDLDNNQAQLIKVEREKKLYKTENSKLKQTCKTNAFISTMVKTLWYYVLYIKIFKPFEKLSTKAACAYFHVMLKETRRLNYDSNVLRELIEANTMMIKARFQKIRVFALRGAIYNFKQWRQRLISWNMKKKNLRFI